MLELGAWTFVVSSRVHGDLGPNASGSGARRSGLAEGRRVVGLRQVHGTEVVVVDKDLDVADGAVADALVTARNDLALVVVTADCAPIGLVAGSVGAVVHAGWKGLANGIVERAVEVVRSLAGADGTVAAVLGPCIHPSSYGFGDDDLDAMVSRLGEGVRSSTADGQPAFDLPAGVQSVLGRLDVTVHLDLAADTADPAFFSHRVRHDVERQGLLAWRRT